MIGRGLVPSTGELVAFEAAARHQSFTRAAAELNLTQAAVSKAIRGLETRLGHPLFDRVRQRVLLTAAGEDYLHIVAPLLQELSEATRRVRSMAPSANILNVAILPTLGIRWLIPRLPGFQSDHPAAIFNFVTRLRPFDLEAEGIDVAIHHGRPAWPKAVTCRLMEERMVPMVSAAYRRAERIATPADLERATLLHQSTRPNAWAMWYEAVGLQTQQAHHGPSFDQFGMVVEAAAAGMGVALLPQFLAEQEVRSEVLEVLFNLPLASGTAYHLVLPEHRPKQLARDFGIWLQGEFAKTE